MKKLLLVLTIIPAILFAQDNTKYMEGAVPVVDGKVVFTREIPTYGITGKELVKVLAEWVPEEFTGTRNKIIVADSVKGVVAIQAHKQFRVKIGLFPSTTDMYFLQTIREEDGKCIFETSRIRYLNNPSSKEPGDMITAEEYITDRYALNKAKTKIFPGTGDYRRNTIDIVDGIAAGAQKAIVTYCKMNGRSMEQQGNNAAVQGNIVSTGQSGAANAAAAENRPAENLKNGNEQGSEAPALHKKEVVAPADIDYSQMEDLAVNGIPDELVQLVTKNGLYIVAVNGRNLNKAIGGKGAIDISSERAAAVFTLTKNTDNILSLLEMADNYTLVYFNDIEQNNQSPMLMIKCRKSQQFDKMFVGHIIEAKIRK